MLRRQFTGLGNTPGKGGVLVVDGGGSQNVSLLGDTLAKAACKNEWAGIIVNGCIRDSGIIDTLPIGVHALGTVPRKSVRRDTGITNLTLKFGGALWRPGDYVFADADGVLILEASADLSEIWRAIAPARKDGLLNTWSRWCICLALRLPRAARNRNYLAFGFSRAAVGPLGAGWDNDWALDTDFMQVRTHIHLAVQPCMANHGSAWDGLALGGTTSPSTWSRLGWDGTR